MCVVSKASNEKKMTEQKVKIKMFRYNLAGMKRSHSKGVACQIVIRSLSQSRTCFIAYSILRCTRCIIMCKQ